MHPRDQRALDIRRLAWAGDKVDARRDEIGRNYEVFLMSDWDKPYDSRDYHGNVCLYITYKGTVLSNVYFDTDNTYCNNMTDNNNHTDYNNRHNTRNRNNIRNDSDNSRNNVHIHSIIT